MDGMGWEMQLHGDTTGCLRFKKAFWIWYHVAEQCLNQHMSHINVLIASFASHLAKRTLAANTPLTVPSWTRSTSKALGCMSAYP